MGKAALSVQVVDKRSGRPIGFRASFLRNLPIAGPFAILGFFPLFGIAGLIWLIGIAIAMRRGPRIGDGWAHTMVVPIRFKDHPNLKRILMWEGYPYHPLRKEFPLAGKPSEMPDVAFSGVAPLEGGPFVTSPGTDRVTGEPRAKGES